MSKIICPKCKGRKTVLDKAALIFTAGIVPILDWITGGTDEDKFMSREKCPACQGKGYVKI